MTSRNNIRPVFLTTLAIAISVMVVKAVTLNQPAVSPFTDVPNPSIQKSLAAFDTILMVLKSPRCMNCHPTGDVPRQGDDQVMHGFNVQRGPHDDGTEVQKCATCHHETNDTYANIPGAPHWKLAPLSMGWWGLSDHEIGLSLLDPDHNGGRTPQEVAHHMGHDSLVLWAWNPGANRTPPPIELAPFRIAVDNWLKNGAHIPEK
jgi:hypothetical protein